MKKYLSIILLLFCSCAFVYHGKGTDEDWAKSYKMSLDNIENKNWDSVELDKKVFAVFNKNYFEKDGFKSKKNSAVILSTMYNKDTASFDNLFNSIPCIIYVNKVNVSPKNKEKYIKRICEIEDIDTKNIKFLGFVNSFQLKEEMIYRFDNEYFETYDEHKNILLDKSIDFNAFDKDQMEELNKLIVEKGHKKYLKDPLTFDDMFILGIVNSIVKQSERYYQLGYKYPCFECTLK